MFEIKDTTIPRKQRKKLYKVGIYDLPSLLAVFDMTLDQFVDADIQRISERLSKDLLGSKSKNKMLTYLAFAKAAILNEDAIESQLPKKTLLIRVDVFKKQTPIVDLETAIACAYLQNAKNVFEVIETDKWLGKYPIYVSKTHLWKFPRIVRALRQNADFIYSC